MSVDVHVKKNRSCVDRQNTFVSYSGVGCDNKQIHHRILKLTFKEVVTAGEWISRVTLSH